MKAAIEEVAGGLDDAVATVEPTVVGPTTGTLPHVGAGIGVHYVYALIDGRRGGLIKNTFYFGRGSSSSRHVKHLGEAAAIRVKLAADPDLTVNGRL